MRRVTALLLAVWISALLMLPAVLAGGQPRVPACCRAAGKHHCSVRHAAPPDSGPALHASRDACAQWHLEQATPPAPAAAPIDSGAAAFQNVLKPHAATAARPVSLYSPAFSRSRQKRGPPVFFA